MTNEEIVDKIIKSIGFSDDLLLNKPRANTRAITAHEIISSIVEVDTVSKAATVLGVSTQTLNKIIAKNFVPLFGSINGGNETWKLKLLTNAKIKRCNSCDVLQDFSKFTIDNSKYDNLNSICRTCAHYKNSNYYIKNKDKYHKVYIEEHRSEYNARNCLRRATKRNAIPSWANLGKIKKFYAQCPDGYHVDHMYPLKSDWVCGFHVIENLQYLTAEDNLRKGNRRTGDW